MKIQQVERQTGITAQSIRYYEREGLILLRTAPTTHLPWYAGETEPVTVEVISDQETALMTLWEWNGKVCLRWETSERTLRWTLLDYDIHNLYRQIKSDIGRYAKEMSP